MILLHLDFNTMTDLQYDQIKQTAEQLKTLKQFEAFLSSHKNLVLSGDGKMQNSHESATVPAIVAADWLAGVRSLLSIVQSRFDKIEINNIND